MRALELSTLSAARRPRVVLHGVSLRVASGHVLALVGPNGACKSTLIRELSGVIPAHSVVARLDSVDLLRLSAATRARLHAIVPQMVHRLEAFTAGEAVLMGRRPHLSFWANVSRRDREMAWRAMRRTQVKSQWDRRIVVGHVLQVRDRTALGAGARLGNVGSQAAND